MNQEHITVAYEAIDNPVLRLLIIFGVSVIGSLAAAIVYLYRERQTLQREFIDMSRESIRVYESLDNTLEYVRRALESNNK